MLKIAIDVKSGIKEFVASSKKKKNIKKFNLTQNKDKRILFLQGILLYLMGERISLYELTNKNNDTSWQERTDLLKDFLSKVELKGRINVMESNVDNMLFSQHRKHGAAIYSNYILDTHGLREVGVSRLNAKFSSFVKIGLFDIFQLPESQLKEVLKNTDWKISKKKLSKAIKKTLKKNNEFDRNNIVSLREAKRLVKRLNKIFIKLDSLNSHEINENTYSSVIDFFFTNREHLSYLRSSRSGFNLAEEERTEKQQMRIKSTINTLEKLSINQIRFSYFMWRYLDMFIDICEMEGKKIKCSSFGLDELNFKNKRGLEALIDWFNDPLKAFENIKKETFAEFYNSLFAGTKYAVSYRAPLQHLRYDGTFELFVQSDLKTEEFIQKKIINSGRWYLRVGKLCLGRLIATPENMTNQNWETIIDDFSTT